MKVIKKFRDKNTKEIHKIGIEYKGSSARITELQKLGYIEKPKKETTKKESE